MSAAPAILDQRDTIAIFVGFTHALRAAGLPVGPDRTQGFLTATAMLDASSRQHTYWAGRATLCSGLDDLAVYDKVFERWFSVAKVGRPGPTTLPPRSVTLASLEEDGADGATGDDEHQVAVLASAEESLRHRDVATLSPDERRRLARMFTALDVGVPMRRSMRRRAHHRGEIDAARTVREQLRRGGEPGPLRHRCPRSRPRRIVFLIDVSGSMDAYADSLLRLAHRVVTAAPHTTEVFTLGTRLTHVTAAMRIRDPEKALLTAGQTVPDWSGGTRLGEMLRAFTDRHGQRGMARGAVIVLASDGWERGDPALLGAEVCRLGRLARRIIWSNPHRGKTGYVPVQGGIAAALPYLDALVAGHSMAAFADLLELIADA